MTSTRIEPQQLPVVEFVTQFIHWLGHFDERRRIES